MPSDEKCLRRYGDTVCRWLAELGISLQSTCVLAAFSGGADSAAMLLLLHSLTERLGFRLVACHVNHGIRGGEAARDAAFCADFCARHGIPFCLKTGDAPALRAERHVGMEEAARILRYRLLEEAADETGADRIATAHTADDHLETVIFNLTRGSGLAGLGGIRAENGRILRPILPLTRTDTERIVAAFGETFVTDSSNQTDLYARNRLRHTVVPVLKRLNPAVSRTVLENSRIVTAETAFLDRLAAEELEKISENGSLAIPKLLAADPVLRARTVRLWAEAAGASLSRERTEALLRLAEGVGASGVCELGGGLLCEKRCDRLLIGQRADAPQPFVWTAEECGHMRLNARFAVCVTKLAADTEKIDRVYKLFNHCLVNCDTINGELRIRSRRSGDVFRKNERSGTKTLKRLMIDRKIPRALRDQIPVVADDLGVIWVWGLGYNAARAKPKDGKELYQIRFQENTNESIQNEK